jgi:PAS domain S-box-containing protein
MLRVEYFGILSSCYLWLIFIAKYTHQDKWLTKRTYQILAIIPLFTFIQILFVEQHDFFYKLYEFKEYKGLLVTEKIYGPGFFISTVFNYSLIIIGTLFLIRRISHMPERFWKQNIPLALVLIVVLIPNFLYISGNNPIDPYDPTPLSFVIMGILFLTAIFAHQFLNVVPVAYNLIFKDLKNGVIIIDKRGHILDMNTKAAHIFNVDIKHVTGDHIKKLFISESIQITDLLSELDYKTEITLSGNEKVYELQISAMEDFHKHIIGRILLFYDIDEQVRAIEELDAFSGMVAHDLKNPLGNILGFTQLMKQKVKFSDDEQIYVENISKSAEKMKNIIDGLLLLANVRSTENILLTELNMKEIVESVLIRLSSMISRYKAHIIKPEVWPVVTGDPLWVEEVWMNYISNALKYGGNPPQIELSSDQIKGFTKFKIKDNGNGISEEEQHTLFTEFSRLKRHKNTVSGHGLGLSIIQRIVSKLGGQTGVESEVGKGSTFWFTLPNV